MPVLDIACLKAALSPPGCKTRMLADEFYPRLVMLERIVMDGLIDAAMDASISLLIANDPQPAHFNRAGE